MALEKNSLTASIDAVRMGEEQSVVGWAPYGGIILTGDSDLIHQMHSFCTIQEMPEIPFTALRDETITALSKKDLRRSIGKKIDPIQVTLHGNSVNALCSFMGVDIDTTPGVEVGPDVEQEGILFEIAYNPTTNTVARTDVIANMKCRVVAIPSMGSGQQTATIELYSDNPVAFSAGS